MAEDLSSGQPRTDPASGQSGTRTRDRWIASPTRWPLGHAAASSSYAQQKRRNNQLQIIRFDKLSKLKVSVNENFSTLLDFVFFWFLAWVGPKFYFGKKRKIRKCLLTLLKWAFSVSRHKRGPRAKSLELIFSHSILDAKIKILRPPVGTGFKLSLWNFQIWWIMI